MERLSFPVTRIDLRVSLCVAVLLFSIVPASAGSWTAPTLTTNTGIPPTNTDVYLYHVGQEKYLTKGTTWTTHAALTENPSSALIYSIQNNGTYYRLYSAGAGGQGYLFPDGDGGNVYCDWNNQNTTYTYWGLETQLNGNFRIVVSNQNGLYNNLPDYCLGWDPNNNDKIGGGGYYNTNVGLFALNPSNSNYELDWTYITPDDLSLYQARLQLYETLLEAENVGVDTSSAGAVYNNSNSTVSELNAAYQALTTLISQASGTGVDMTDLLVNPDFSDPNGNGWTYTPGLTAIYGGFSQFPCAEAYGMAFEVYQDVSNVPNGIYKITTNSFYRPSGNGSYNGSESVPVNLFLDDFQTPVQHILADAISTNLQQYVNYQPGNRYAQYGWTYIGGSTGSDYNSSSGWVPNSMTGASIAFSAGRYLQTTYGLVTDGSMRIGLTSNGNTIHWCLWSNFKLVYMGKDETAENDIITSLTSRANTILSSGAVYGNPDKTALQSAVSNAASANNADDKYDAIIALNAAINHANTSIENYTLLYNALRDFSDTYGTSAAGYSTIYSSYRNRTYTYEEALAAIEALETVEYNYLVSLTANANQLVINEIQSRNIDMFIDPSYNYGSWIELYNPTSGDISLGMLYVSDDASNLQKFHLHKRYGIIAAGGYKNNWFDHNSIYGAEAYKQVPFKLEPEGGTIYISDTNGNLILSQVYPATIGRTSYARTNDGGSTWATTAEPTPEATNTTSSWATQQLDAPVVDTDAQVFTSTLNINVSIPTGTTLRYTTDGSTPTATNGNVSNSGSFSVSNTTVYRFRLFADGYIPSEVVTRSYIYKDRDYDLPIISVVTDDKNLNDNTIGVWVHGTNGRSGNGVTGTDKANWNMDWERPVNFEYLNSDGEAAFAQEVDFAISGGWSRKQYPRSFKLKASKVYGLNDMEYRWFEDKPYNKYKQILVRNGGNDNYAKSRVKDNILQQILLRSGLYIDAQERQPAHVFLNGDFIGTMNIREVTNKQFGYSNYGLDTDYQDAFEMSVDSGYVQTTGTREAFEEWYELAKTASDAASYERICELVDIEEYINYMAAQFYLTNWDWPHNNLKAFRAREDTANGHGEGKFHFVIFDLDNCYDREFNPFTDFEGQSTYTFYPIFNEDGSSYTITAEVEVVTTFLNMLQNATFKKKFIDAFCIITGSVFEPTRCAEIIEELRAQMYTYISWEGNGGSVNDVAYQLNNKLTSAMQSTMINYLRSYLNLSSPNTVSLSSNVEGATLRINDLEVPTGTFSGSLFYPITVKAQAPAGYRFAGWKNANDVIVSTDSIFALQNTGYTLTATFNKLSDAELLADIAMPIKVNEIGANNDIYINEFFKKRDWFELYNTTDTDLNVAGLYISDDIDDPLKYQIPTSSVLNTIVPANGHIVVWADEMSPTTQLHAPFKLNNTDGQLLLITSSDQFVNNNAAFFDAHPALQSFADGLTYVQHGYNQTVGRYPDGGNTYYLMTRPTIEKTNSLLADDTPLGVDKGIMSSYTATVSLDLYEGWNWMSHPMSAALPVSSFDDYADRILSQTLEAYYSSSTHSMKGLLKKLSIGSLYKVEMSDDHSYEFTGQTPSVISPTVLRAGWNWIGYPVIGTQTISAALAGSNIQDGDIIVGQSGFSVYDANDGWEGSLSSLSTGQGYLYKSVSAKSIRFNKPTASAVKLRRIAANDATARRYGYDKHAYPNVMGIIARVQMDGQALESNRFNIVAYSDKECRGAGKCVNDVLFMTLYGQGGEELSFKVFDEDGEEYAVSETMTFSPDIVGTTKTPYIFNIAGETTEVQSISTAVIPVGYYSLSGVRVSTTKTGLRPGIYIVRYSDGKYKKVLVR